MARQLQEIRVLNSGIISNPDETDITIEAASNSLNIDSVSKDGVLTGLPGDSYINPTNQEGVTVLSFADTINSIEYSRREMLLLQTASGNWTFTTSPD